MTGQMKQRSDATRGTSPVCEGAAREGAVRRRGEHRQTGDCT